MLYYSLEHEVSGLFSLVHEFSWKFLLSET